MCCAWGDLSKVPAPVASVVCVERSLLSNTPRPSQDLGSFSPSSRPACFVSSFPPVNSWSTRPGLFPRVISTCSYQLLSLFMFFTCINAHPSTIPPFFPKHSVLSSLPALCTGLGLDLVCAWCSTVGHVPSAPAQPACGPITPGRAPHAFQSVSASGWPSVTVERNCRGRGVCFNFSQAQECCRRAAPSPCPRRPEQGVGVFTSTSPCVRFWFSEFCQSAGRRWYV